MVSKILIDVQSDGKPMIRVNLPDYHGPIDDVRDKLVKMFFEGLGHESPFVGVVDASIHEEVKELIPLSIGHALEWMERLALKDGPDSEVFAAFTIIRRVLGLQESYPKEA